MIDAANDQPLVLTALGPEQALPDVLERAGCAVVRVQTGTLAVERARDLQPDVIVLEAALPDMSGLSACRLLHGDLRVAQNVPILVLASERPTPEERVAALHAGAWDFLRFPAEPAELAVRIEAYVQAKRNTDRALADGLFDPASGVHTRSVLARRARELGAVMARTHGALACVVFASEGEPLDLRAGSLIARAARVSDVVAAMSPTEYAVLAPTTDAAGALRLARRVAAALVEGVAGGAAVLSSASLLQAGYDAVANLKYLPVDPVELIARAGAALRHGTPEPEHPWVRRFDGRGARTLTAAGFMRPSGKAET